MFQRALPLADQLIQQLRKDIASAAITGPNGRLPSEGELCERYGVSRVTVREALAKLELAGAISRRHGVGTFVHRWLTERPKMISTWLDEAPYFEDMIQRSGYTPHCDVLQVSSPLAAEVAETLGLSPAAPVILIEKLFLANSVPIIYSQTKVPPLYLGEPVTDRANGADWRPPIYLLLEQMGQRRVTHQYSDLVALTASEHLAKVLTCDVGAPLLRVEEVGYNADEQALFHAVHHFRGEWVSFRQIRRPTFAVVGA
jgi:GntR family transcriptional regulator